MFNLIKGRPALQSFLERCHLSLLRAMGIGTGGEAETSGEKLALQYIKNRLSPEARPVLFDVGANIGNYTKLLAEHFPDGEIFAFEPSPETFRALRENCPPSVRPFNLGFGERAGKTTLYTNKSNRTIASVYPRKLSGKHALGETEEITMGTIDNFCERENISKIDLLKLDVEGHELQCLRGAQRMLSENKIRFIQFEFGGCNVDSRTFFRDFYELLSEKYKIYRIMQHGLYEIKKCSETYELFLTANYLAECKTFKEPFNFEQQNANIKSH